MPQFTKDHMFGIKWKFNKGFTIVEILVVMFVIVSTFAAILGFFSLDIRVSERNRMRLQALSLAEEAIEAVRSFGNVNSWQNGIGGLAIGAEYHPIVIGSIWNIVSESENINNFNRKIIISPVSRDNEDNIENTYNPANNDPNTRKISVIVSWADRIGLASESIGAYLTNWK